MYLLSSIVLAIFIYLILTGYMNWRFFILAVPFLVLIRLLTPIRPADLILHNPDGNYLLQIVEYILAEGQEIIGAKFLTGEARQFVVFPVLHLNVVAASLVARVPPAYFLKFGGSFLVILNMVFLERFYRLLLNNRALSSSSALLASMYPYFTNVESYIVNQTIATTFLMMLLVSIPRARDWKLISVVCLLGIAISHNTTGFLTIVVLMISKIVSTVLRRFQGFPERIIPSWQTIALAIAFVAVWWTYVGTIWVGAFGGFAQIALSHLFEQGFGSMAVVTASGMKPQWIVTLEWAGFATFGISAALCFIHAIKDRNDPGHNLVPYSAAGFVIFALFFTTWTIGVEAVQAAKEVFARAFLYVYALCAPLALLSTSRVATIFQRGRSPRRLLGPPVGVLLIFLIIVPSVYYAVQPMYYDRATPFVHNDVRLYPQQWQTTAYFASSRVPFREVYGVSLAWSYVGGLAGKSVYIFADEPSFSSLEDWTATHRGDLMLLRFSWLRVAEFGGYSPSPEEWRHVMNQTNALYSTGEIIIIGD